MSELTREALYELVWSEPMLKVAARYDVSSSYLARVCSLLNVPRPERGYWAKLAVGKRVQKPELPEAQPGDPVEWSRDGISVRTSRALPRPPPPGEKKTRRSGAQPSAHPLIVGAKALFEAGRVSHDIEYLKPYKKLLVDLAVSKNALDKALQFANDLFLALETAGFRVMIAAHGESFRRIEIDVREDVKRGHGHWGLWTPGRCTIVYVGTVAIGLTVVETTEEVSVRYVNGKYIREDEYVPPKRGRYAVDTTWSTQKHVPTGRLRLIAYSPYWRAEWSKQWHDTDKSGLASQISAIVKDIEQAVPELARLVELGAQQAEAERREWDAQQERWRREEAERRTKEAYKQSKASLVSIIEQWAERQRVEEFFSEAERAAAQLEPGQRARILNRLEAARKMLGNTNPLERLAGWKSPGESLLVDPAAQDEA